jgi:predicted Co/Zn/Cd cation transporter (cation efflux family)
VRTSIKSRANGSNVIPTSSSHGWFINILFSLICFLGAAGIFVLALLFAKPVWAQNPPGEDPVILNKQVVVQMLPIGATRSAPIETLTGMPAWLKAKVVRYEAKANSDSTAGISTDADVTRTASSDGFKKTCVQEVGSVTTTSPNGGIQNRNVPQVVVLKGDLVNICK